LFEESVVKRSSGTGRQELAYSSPSDLSKQLEQCFRGSISSIDLYVSSVEQIRVGFEFLPSDFVELNEENLRKYNIQQRSDGAVLQDGEPVNVVFEEFYLDGVLDSGGSSVDIVAQQFFAQVSRSVRYAEGICLDPAGRPYRDVVDFRLLPRRKGWQDELLDSAKGLVAVVAGAAEIAPSLFFKKLNMFIAPEQMPQFLGTRAYSSQAADMNYPSILF
jgi:hypothetical protein